jgi:spore coat protein U-like protein
MNIRLLGVVWLMMTSAAFAADCSVSAQDINFGEYDLVSALDSSGTLTVSCRKTKSGNETVNYTLSLSVGAGSYGGRELRNGGSTMFYNLYSDVSRTVVWGDGGGAARVSGRIRMRLFMSNASADHTVYGRIPGNQGNLEPGVYSSPAPIVVTVEY